MPTARHMWFIGAALLSAVMCVSRADAPAASDGHHYNVCSLVRAPDSVVGSEIAVEGMLEFDMHAIELYSNSCPRALVHLRLIPGGPQPDLCITGSRDPRCGGLSDISQIVTVFGKLLQRLKIPATKGYRSNVMYIVEAKRFEVHTH